MYGADTIAALSSASGAAHLAIIRVSGSQAIQITGSLCPRAGLEEAPGFHAVPAVIEVPGLGGVQCRLYIFRAPNSYTTEDTAEIHLPGSPPLVEKVLLTLAARGARPAAPGEFTRRAYLGGRVDLAQAESVSALINARSRGELAAAGRVLAGSLSEKIHAAAARLKDLLALVEASIDFSDQDIELVSAGEISSRIRGASELLEAAAGRERRPGRDMLRILICGVPNVGKSSLFNRLLGRERALTSTAPGTTRDIVSAVLTLGGIQVLLLDSAGRRDPESAIEELALSALEKSLAEADVALFVIEAYRPPTEGELEFFNRLECRKLLVANKCDLAREARSSTAQLFYYQNRRTGESRAVLTSCRTGEGIEKLRETLRRLVLGKVERHPDALALSVRQRDALSRASGALARSAALLLNCSTVQEQETVEQESCGFAAELLAEDLREALTALGEITGETLTEEILDRIFNQFCIGK